MPRYFFNSHNGKESVADTDGLELEDDAEARKEAIAGLSEMAREELPKDGDRTDISIHVTDAEGKPLFSVRIDFYVTPKT